MPRMWMMSWGISRLMIPGKLRRKRVHVCAPPSLRVVQPANAKSYKSKEVVQCKHHAITRKPSFQHLVIPEQRNQVIFTISRNYLLWRSYPSGIKGVLTNFEADESRRIT